MSNSEPLRKYAIVPNFFSKHSNMGSNIVYLRRHFGLKYKRMIDSKAAGSFFLCTIESPGFIVLSTLIRACPITQVSYDGVYSGTFLKKARDQFIKYYNPKKKWNDNDTEATWIQGQLN